jgi:hypothetical protein
LLFGGEWSQWSGLAESVVRPVTVVVKFVLAKYGRGVAPIDDEDAVEEFASDGADEAFGNGVGPGRPHGRPDDLDAVAGEDGVEGRGELGIAIADEELEPPASLVEVHGQVASKLSQPRSGRARCNSEDVDTAGGVLDSKERVQPLQCDGVDVKQVAGQDAVRLSSQELGPGGSGTAG